MNKEELISKKIIIAEKAVKELSQAGDLKKLNEETARQIAGFYETKTLNRLQTAKHLYETSKEPQKHNLPQEYTDYGEAVAAAYYAMYYIVHAYLAANYQTKLREDLRGVHAITHNLILYYLVKTKKIAQHLYDEYLLTLETASVIQNLTVDSFQQQAYNYAEKYNKSREARETFTYKTTPAIEAYNAEQAIKIAEEFIYTIRQLIMKEQGRI
ncbi:MAG: hypothetical protein NTW67_05270 [Candidatus Woesearchaeota archaeon]|nr:hypothetical protein [Candidatus Woesearchaeota archaeon]